MAKILFCDDEIYRYECLVELGILPKDTRFESNALKCFDLLETPNDYDEIWLDHDFNNQTHHYGVPVYDGEDLAYWLVQFKFEGLVKIHSMNSKGVRAMTDILNRGSVKNIPVNLLDCLGTKLKWIGNGEEA